MESKHDRTGFHFYRTKRIVILLLFLTALAAHALVQTAGLFPVFRASVSADASYLPSKYETKARTPVLNQKNDPLCWAYSATDMLNISAVMQGLAGQGTALYSAPAFARGIYTGDEYRIVSTPSLWYRYSANAGHALMSAASGKGLMYGSRCSTVEEASAITGSAIYDVDGYVSEFRFFDIWDKPSQKVTKIKEWVYRFGSVSASAFLGKYDPVRDLVSADKWDYTKVSHAFLIVGWDDSKSTDTGTGAFLIKNTWGSSWGNGGYAYLSYKADMGGTIYAAQVEPAYGKTILTHTEIMPQGSTGYKKDAPAGVVNVFTAKESMTLYSAKIFIDEPGTVSVKVWLKPGSIGPELLDRAADAGGSLTVAEPGYYQVKLDRPLTLNAGDKVAAQFISETSDRYRVYGEYVEIIPPEWNTVSSSGETYRFAGNTFTETGHNYLGALVGTLKNPPKTASPATPSPTPTPVPAKTQAPSTPVPANTAAPSPVSTGAPATKAPETAAVPTGGEIIQLITEEPEFSADGVFTPDPHTQEQLDIITGGLKKIGRIAGIAVAVAVVGFVLILALARSGTDKKKK